MSCSNGGHTFKDGLAFGKKCDCGMMKLEKTLTLDKNGANMARVVPSGELDRSLGAVVQRASQNKNGRGSVPKTINTSKT